MISVQGENNQTVCPDSLIHKNSKITIIGNNNEVILGENVKIMSANIRLKGNNIKLHISDNVELTGTIIYLFTNTSLFIGQNSTLGNGEMTIAEECSIEIGCDCMFAHGFDIRTSDMHPIYDRVSGDRINLGQSIKLGNHIWLGRDVVILKGVELADNIVVGIRAVVSKSYTEPNSILVGMPEKCVGSNIVWGRKMFHKTMFDDPTLVEYYAE